MMKIVNRRRLGTRVCLPTLGLVLAVSVASPTQKAARADLSDGYANSTGYSINTTLNASVLNIGALSVNTAPPLGQATGSAPSTYNNTTSGAVGVNVANLINVGTTEPTNANATSNVDGSAGSKSTSASDSVASATASVLTGVSLMNLGTGVVNTQASVSGTPGSLTTSESVYIASLSISILGTNILAGVPASEYTGNIAANTVLAVSGISGLTGTISIILNEETSSITNNTASVSVNAIDVRFTNVGVTVLGANVASINGDLIIGHSDASMTAIPVPPSMVMTCSGLLAAFGTTARRLRSRQKIDLETSST